MTIPVVCPSCSARLKAPDRAAGGKLTCPKCNESVSVPHPERSGFSERGRDRPKLSDDAFDEDLPTPPDVSRTGVTLLIVGVVVAVIGLILTTVLLARSLFTPKPAAPPTPVPVAPTPLPQQVPPTQGEPVYADATKGAVRFGDYEVLVLGVTYAKVPIIQILGDAGESSQPYLMVRVGIRNLSMTKKLDYFGWGPGGCIAPGGLAGGGGIVPMNPTPATLKDDLGNTYKTAPLEAGVTLKNQKYRESIHPGKNLDDFIIFEPPVQKASALLLDLPLKVLGGGDTAYFRIPTNRVNRDLFEK